MTKDPRLSRAGRLHPRPFSAAAAAELPRQRWHEERLEPALYDGEGAAALPFSASQPAPSARQTWCKAMPGYASEISGTGPLQYRAPVPGAPIVW